MEEIKEENKGTKRRIVMFGILLFGVVLILEGVTYAFFAGDLGQTKNEVITVKSGTLQLTFKDYSTEATPGVNGTWTFGDSIEKELVIKNTGTLDAYAKISWDNLVNTYLAQSLTYTLEEKSDEEEAEYHTVNTGNVPQSTTSSTKELANGLLIKAGKTYTYKLTITLEDLPNVNQTDDLEAIFITKFTLEEGEEADNLLLNTIMKKSNPIEVNQYILGTQGEMYTFDHDEAEQTTGWSAEERRDYRYIGATPNNWIKFNDEDWRIIGVFTTEIENGTKEQLVKIIRNESIGSIPCDDYTDGSSTSDWSTSSLYGLLNGDYYNTDSSFSYTYKDSSSSTETTVTIPKGLNGKAQNQVEKVKWYLGGMGDDNKGGPDSYSFERGTEVLSERTPNIKQRVGLMYPSDYMYTYGKGVYDACYTNSWECSTYYQGTPSVGWLYNDSYSQWTHLVYANYALYTYYVGSDGYVSYTNEYVTKGVRPVVFLKSNVKITGGDGSSSENAYILE